MIPVDGRVTNLTYLFVENLALPLRHLYRELQLQLIVSLASVDLINGYSLLYFRIVPSETMHLNFQPATLQAYFNKGSKILLLISKLSIYTQNNDMLQMALIEGTALKNFDFLGHCDAPLTLFFKSLVIHPYQQIKQSLNTLQKKKCRTAKDYKTRNLKNKSNFLVWCATWY